MKTEAEALAKAKTMKGKVLIWFHEERRSYVVRPAGWPRPKDKKWHVVTVGRGKKM